MKINCVVYLFLLFFFPTARSKKRWISEQDFLFKEKSNIIQNYNDCPLKTITRSAVYSLWHRNQASVEAHICLIKYLESRPKDGTSWAMLGFLYSLERADKEADFCFQSASKLVDDDMTLIKEWHFLGPFTVGKTEFDGDPLEAYGGIQNVSRYRYDLKLPKYLSEISQDGEISWRAFSVNLDDFLQVRPSIDWSDLVSSLSSMGITEWQGWLVGEFVTTKSNKTFSVQCSGTARCIINNMMVAGDFYRRTDYWTAVRLSRGVHRVFIPMRAKVAGNFRFSISKQKNYFQIVTPSFLPQIYDGYMPEETYLSIPFTNLRNTKWLTVSKVSVLDSSNKVMWMASLYNKEYQIAPGQTMPVIVKLSSDEMKQGKRISTFCNNIHIEFMFTTSEGGSTFDVTLSCRKKGGSFLFTFLDHDGSLQHAATIEPLRSCPKNICPVLLSLHGTTVPPLNQADSYKRMVNKEFEFGVTNMWLLAPTRHGAHNWEGPGALTAMSAVEALHTMVESCHWLETKVNPMQILFAGHSMGGHGALHLATHFPDRAIGLMSLAGWIKKEDYGDSNLFFRHDVATSHVDPITKSIMESCVAENDVDKHVSNLKDIPVLLRIGSRDRTVHPYFLRRMYRLMKEVNINVHYSELPNLEHWWWDTKTTNDGGCMNDADIRKFVASVYSGAFTQRSCSENRYSEKCQGRHVTFVTYNPAFGETLKGIKVLQQIVPFQKSTIKVEHGDEGLVIITKNVQCLELTDDVPDAAILWDKVDGSKTVALKINDDALTIEQGELPVIFCKYQTHWHRVMPLPGLSRHPENYGPARRVAEREFVIVTGTQSSPSVSTQILILATYIANQFWLTSDAFVPIIEDRNLQNYMTEGKNLIIIGNLDENSFTKEYLGKLRDLKIEDGRLSLGGLCHFESSRVGLLTLSPLGKDRLALVLMGRSMAGLTDVVNLATPTIPPMARSPFSNLLPDYVITGPETALKGPGGFECIGFWDNNWKYSATSSSCMCG